MYLYKTGKLLSKNPLPYLCRIKDGTDGTGKNLSYKVCDGSPTYDFTTKGPGYPSGGFAGCVRNHGTSGGAIDTFYYIGWGTGNQLRLGVTARALNKVHGVLLLIRRAGELNFGKLSTFLFTNQFTSTQKVVTLSDGKLSNSFTMAPQLLLLEVLVRQNSQIAFQNPTDKYGFGIQAAEAVNPKNQPPWPFASIQAHEEPQTDFNPLLQWYFGYKKVQLPDTSDYTNNWNSWNKQAVQTLGMFFDAVTVPEFDSWELNYVMNRMANSSAYDPIIYALIGAKNVEITKTADTITTSKTATGDIYNGTYNHNGEYIDTFCCSIQPGGAGGWAFELIDYRLNLKNAGGSSTIWSEYANKYIAVRNPIASYSDLQSCTPRYCTQTDIPACEVQSEYIKDIGCDLRYKYTNDKNISKNTGRSLCLKNGSDSEGNDDTACNNDNPPAADWLVLSCQAPIAPVVARYSCDPTTKMCSKDASGPHPDLASCNAACSTLPPSVDQCKDVPQAAYNYCSKWCNDTRTKWGCGTNSNPEDPQGDMTCNCAGCNGCAPPN